MAFKQAVVSSAAVRAQPIALTGLAAMIDDFFILDAPAAADLSGAVPVSSPTSLPEGSMNVDRLIQIFAGSFILLSLALGVAGSPLYVSPWWLAFTAFVGANLLQFGFSQVCPLGWMLKKLCVPESAACAR